MANKQKKQSFKKQLKLAWTSFKTKKLLLLSFLELAGLLFVILGFYLWTNSLQSLEPAIAAIEAGTMADSALMSTVQSLLYKLAISTSLLAIYLFVIMAFFKSFIYSRLVKSKYTLKYYFKALGLSFFSGLFALIIAAIFAVIAIPLLAAGKTILTTYIVLLMLIGFFMLYLFILWYINFAITNKIWKGFKLMIEQGILGIKKFSIPLLAIILVFFLLNLILLPFSFLPNIPYLTITLIFSLFYLSWINIYLYNVKNEKQ